MFAAVVCTLYTVLVAGDGGTGPQGRRGEEEGERGVTGGMYRYTVVTKILNRVRCLETLQFLSFFWPYVRHVLIF